MGFGASFSPRLVEADRDCLMSQDRAVTLAVIIGAHGVTGEVRLKLFSDDPARLKQYKVFAAAGRRSEEHTSELQSLMRISYAVFCLKKKNKYHNINTHIQQTHIQ